MSITPHCRAGVDQLTRENGEVEQKLQRWKPLDSLFLLKILPFLVLKGLRAEERDGGGAKQERARAPGAHLRGGARAGAALEEPQEGGEESRHWVCTIFDELSV